ncbi:MAG: ORF6N domain-containing protein [Cytophagales bacterium]|nr:ORF6N domain-containing protein [Cytophagales bacterium]MCA6369518.1 ORF6N domain-containing protein [Cytophagales bacterium]MCA6373449.1 ORF6N domain-containing protein [Cytophagales bacterium]MCA6375848.1 ORF6N domain-containing protein [Cytophagales bacterium]MCA6386045.1 ORF6N domain-containing protein [Cytophagales bacterium]
MSKSIAITDETVINKIYRIRGKKVMLDRDLADMYGVETGQLKRQVKRNSERFPEDFMFEMSQGELQDWRSQFGISKEDKKGLRYPPFCFTEQGVAMLSSVLGSKTAIDVNIQIIRIFTRIRETLLTHQDLLIKMERIEKKLLQHDEKSKKHEEEIQIIFKALKQLLNQDQEPRKEIGFKTKGK